MLRFFFFLFLASITRRIKIKIYLYKKEKQQQQRSKEIVWKFKRNISFCFDSAILLSFKQIIIQTQGRRKIIMKAENNTQKKTLSKQHKHCTEGNNEKTLKYSMRSRGKCKEKFQQFLLLDSVFFLFLSAFFINNKIKRN